MCSSPPNPREWRFTWETLAHIPTIRLFLFNTQTNPSNQCLNLKASLNFEESTLLLSWIEQTHANLEFLVRVPVPRVLIDLGSPVNVIARDDHIEVKLVLLLPIDHPLTANFDSVLNSSGCGEDFGQQNEVSDRLLPLSLDSDIKNLSSGGVVHFYCKSCSIKLTKKPLRSFLEMPSVNWREAADNWFGACCCSFGGISEKLVSEYVNSYICAEGMCLFDGTSVTTCQEDLVGYAFPDCLDRKQKHDSEFDPVGIDDLVDTAISPGSYGRETLCCENVSKEIANVCETLSKLPLNEEILIANPGNRAVERQNNTNTSCCLSLSIPDSSDNVVQGAISCFTEKIDDSHFNLNKLYCANDICFLDCNSNLSSENLEEPCLGLPPAQRLSFESHSHCCVDETNYVLNLAHERSSHGVSMASLKSQQSKKNAELLKNQKWVHNGSLGSGFMIRTSNLSNDIEWVEYRCNHCSSLLGSFPSTNDGHTPVDGGIRLSKCYISTSVPVGGPHDIFRNHNLQRMFVNRLLESASDELSFRTLVRDLRTKTPMLQIVLLNSKSWCCTGYCSEMENGTRCLFSKIDLHPVVKVLFSDCSMATDAELSILEEWTTKSQADEVYMMTHQIKELIETLKSAQQMLPFSCSFMQGMSVSSLER